MKFRPCIDLHNGQVKQIVGSTLRKDGASTTDLETNFVSNRPAAEFAEWYKRDGLIGGHVILLGSNDANKKAALSALKTYPGALQVGGGITDTTCRSWLDAGASHVVVTSYLFERDADGDKPPRLSEERLEKLVNACGGPERIVIDLSCRKKTAENGDGGEDLYYVVMDKWQTFTDCSITPSTLQHLSRYCSEFLVHGVDVEGKQCGILADLVKLLGDHSPVSVTYAGGVRSMDDVFSVQRLGGGKVDVTIGSALDCFGGLMSYDEVVAWHKKEQQREGKK